MIKTVESAKPRVIVDPRVQEAEEAFQRMMKNFRSKSREEHIRDGIARGVLDAEGNPIPRGRSLRVQSVKSRPQLIPPQRHATSSPPEAATPSG